MTDLNSAFQATLNGMSVCQDFGNDRFLLKIMYNTFISSPILNSMSAYGGNMVMVCVRLYVQKF